VRNKWSAIKLAAKRYRHANEPSAAKYYVWLQFLNKPKALPQPDQHPNRVAQIFGLSRNRKNLPPTATMVAPEFPRPYAKNFVDTGFIANNIAKSAATLADVNQP
jgi:hypothetical protein